MKFYFLHSKAIENIHAGMATASTDSIDKAVQRDASGIPCVENTGFKGALKMHFRDNNVDTSFIDAAFGGEGKNDSELSTGQYGPKQLDLLAIPVPLHPVPVNLCSAVPVTSWEILDRLYEDIILCQPVSDKCILFKENYYQFRIANYPSTVPFLYTPSNENIAVPHLTSLGKNRVPLMAGPSKELPAWLEQVVFNEYDLTRALVISDSHHFEQFVNDAGLPVKPRNHIEWGESKNLWMEQFLPRGTRFVTHIRIPEILYKKNQPSVTDHFKTFEENTNKKCIQTGANKSVGYGVSYFELV